VNLTVSHGEFDGELTANLTVILTANLTVSRTVNLTVSMAVSLTVSLTELSFLMFCVLQQSVIQVSIFS